MPTEEALLCSQSEKVLSLPFHIKQVFPSSPHPLLPLMSFLLTWVLGKTVRLRPDLLITHRVMELIDGGQSSKNSLQVSFKI